LEVTQQQDGVVHAISAATSQPRLDVVGVALDSLPLALVRAIDPRAAASVPAITPARAAQVTINYAGPPGAVPRPYDLDLVANGLFDPRAYAGKVVLIGATDPALKDLFPGPFDRGAALTPGVEINAEAVRTLLLGRPLRGGPSGDPAPAGAGAVLGLGALVLAGNLRLRPLAASLWSLALFVGYAGLAQILFTRDVWLDVAGPLLAALAVYVAAQAARVAESLRELRRVERIFGRYVSPDVVRQLLGKGDALRLGGQRREINVLFCDIRGFTTLSERLPPEAVGTMLNTYFTAWDVASLVDAIFAHGGTVDKFVGDAIMAVWGAPLDQADHALRAVQTSQAMQAAVAALVAQWEAQGRGPHWETLRIGIGIHGGPAVVGSFGAERRSDYTAIGNTVNVASRLESLSKDLGCAIVISAATARALPATSEATFQAFRSLGRVAVKGRDEPLEGYRLRRG
jgi:adenylate cyclase